MCYPIPGPRCSSHTGKELKAAQDAYLTTLAEVQKADYTDTSPEDVETSRSLMPLREAMYKAQAEFDGTAAGTLAIRAAAKPLAKTQPVAYVNEIERADTLDDIRQAKIDAYNAKISKEVIVTKKPVTKTVTPKKVVIPIVEEEEDEKPYSNRLSFSDMSNLREEPNETYDDELDY